MISHKIIQGGYFNDTLRSWQTRTSRIDPQCLIYPIFISSDENVLEEIKRLPGQYRIGANKLKEHLRPAVEDGLRTVLLFGIMKNEHKDDMGSNIISTHHNPVFQAIKVLKQEFPSLTIACDVCLCGYTSHGHCGVLTNSGVIDNRKSVELISNAALSYAHAGCDIVAPSDVMDGRIKAISDALKKDNIRNKVSIMSYSAKFASCFYGPFRDAAGSAPTFGDRRCYQLPPGASGLANRLISRDIKEEADILMVKPGMIYLDVVKDTKTKYPNHPLAIYQVSGEYAMLYYASQHGAFELKKAVFESLESMHRAGADILITYYAPQVLKWLKE
ncbi:delta-aminolevulinic acid dehydratase-like [Hydractinia symbiolongicarpus]|uniref:delta-aminolevulinic acid dehydratase-like n=1 Tax=Hydractinia symbiolongicarpus TaxID=13093 RepID=UPI00254CF88F|nr:delta-aminolevulinic acid dehydratase-like [Hydractinia symbiolongicarpus]